MPHINPLVLVFAAAIAAAVYIIGFEAEPVGEDETAEAMVLPEPTAQSDQQSVQATAVSSITALPSHAPGSESATDDEKVLTLADPNPNYATFGHRYSEISARRHCKIPDPHTLLAASQKTSAWEPTDAAPEKLALTDEELMMAVNSFNSIR